MKRTIIYLHSAELMQASFAILNEDNIEEITLNAHLSEIDEEAKNQEITIIVPPPQILLTQTQLPAKLSRHRTMQALPFALEEQLIDDVSELHFALADDKKSHLAHVAIVSRQQMENWLDLFNQFDIKPSYLFSAIFALPFSEKNWYAFLERENAVVRTDPYQGFTTEVKNFNATLNLVVTDMPEKPECIHVYNTTGFPLAYERETPVLNEILLSETAWLEQLCRGLNPSQAINLLQGPYQAKRKTSETKKIWLAVAYAAIAWVALTLTAQMISFFILEHQVNRFETAIHSIYQKNFQNASAFIAPRERMETKLKELAGQASKNPLLSLLAAIGEPLSSLPSIQLKSLDFRDNQLSLELTAAKFADLDNFSKAIMQQGLKVKQQNAEAEGSAVKANILIQQG